MKTKSPKKVKEKKKIEERYLEKFVPQVTLQPVINQTLAQPSPYTFVNSVTTSGAYEDTV